MKNLMNGQNVKKEDVKDVFIINIKRLKNIL